MALRLSALNRFPVKSCRGEPLEHAVVEPWGLRGDRRWMVVDERGDAITAREVHRMLLVRPGLAEGGLCLSAPDVPPLSVRTPDGSTLVRVAIFGTPVDASPAGAEADAWFSKVLGATARLVYLDDPTRRPTNPERTRPDDRVSFADGYPLLLATEESLTALNDFIAEGPLADEGPLPMIRFRPSVVVRGAPAWSEDGWRRIRIGAAEFRAVKGCDRCVITTLDPDTAASGKEPIATLSRHRRWDGKTWFGVNLVPDLGRGDVVPIDVGDEVEVLAAADPSDGPLR
ncbi:MAG TPA: MOSC N-terminal beta barrel domain-containing protein [Jatrophihabitantaceae bacterium]